MLLGFMLGLLTAIGGPLAIFLLVLAIDAQRKMPWFPNSPARYRRTELVPRVRGFEIAGDLSVAPTRWFNKWWMHLRGWSKLVTLEFSPELAQKGCSVAFRLFDGKEKITRTLVHDDAISLYVGREGVHLFVFDADGDEINKDQIKVTYSRRY